MLKNGQARKARATSSEAMTSRVGEMAIASARMRVGRDQPDDDRAGGGPLRDELTAGLDEHLVRHAGDVGIEHGDSRERRGLRQSPGAVAAASAGTGRCGRSIARFMLLSSHSRLPAAKAMRPSGIARASVS